MKRQYNHEYYMKHRDRLLPAARAYSQKRVREQHKNWELKFEFIAAYGGKCICCGETTPEFLTLDHIRNNGAAHRHQFPNRKSGVRLYEILKKQGWPKGDYQLLCFNCNSGRALNGGLCPHQTNQPHWLTG